MKYTPELSEMMRKALINAVEALRMTEVFERNMGLETDDLNEIVKDIDDLLDRIDEKTQES